MCWEWIHIRVFILFLFVFTYMPISVSFLSFYTLFLWYSICTQPRSSYVVYIMDWFFPYLRPQVPSQLFLVPVISESDRFGQFLRTNFVSMSQELAKKRPSSIRDENHSAYIRHQWTCSAHYFRIQRLQI
ncbi:hypothetical protein GYMLUDRAFT_412066 [Collybiopsis luxurians FD-317 M1]|nr:hypothetical protein GYMLUDRAFT_412066 [Collybiopsis luxurians FD-317 M1]